MKAICGKCEKEVRMGRDFLQILGIRKIADKFVKVVVCGECEKKEAVKS